MRDLCLPSRATFAAIGLTAALVGCGSTIDLGLPTRANAEAHGQKVTVSPALNGKAVNLAIGQQLDVRLPTNPVTGFDWVRDGADTGVLAALGPPSFERERLDTNEFDNAGFDIWRFKPVAAGQQNLRFEYRRRGQLATEAPEAVWFLITVR